MGLEAALTGQGVPEVILGTDLGFLGTKRGKETSTVREEHIRLPHFRVFQLEGFFQGKLTIRV